MEISKSNLYKIFLVFLLLVTSLCYEIHVFKFYSIIQAIVSFILILIMFVYIRLENNVKEKNKIIRYTSVNEILIFLLLFLRLFNTILGYIIFEFNTFTDIIRAIIMTLTTISLFCVIPRIIKKNENIEKIFKSTYILICLVLSFFSILIKINNGHFLLWRYVYVIRDASIYYDPNFCAMILGSGATLAMFHKYKNNFIKLIIIIIIFSAILFTGSRGTLLGLLAAILIYLIIYSKLSIGKKIIFLFFFGIVAYFGIGYLYSIDFFRTYQGSNDRFEMWSNVLTLSIKSPIFGYGYGATDEVLKTINFTYASTHNSFLDFLIIYGFPTFIIYIVFILNTLFKSLKNKNNRAYILTLIFMLINSNTILYSFGGVGLSSLMFTIILGLLCYSNNNYNEESLK